MANKKVIRILAENKLKITPQRTAILEVILNLNNHPSAEDITQYLRLNYPHIPIGTVYKNLDLFVKKGIITPVRTSNESMRYDPVKEKHHHLYAPDSDILEDFFDDDLIKLLNDYFNRKKIPDFKIDDIKLQIIGRHDTK